MIIDPEHPFIPGPTALHSVMYGWMFDIDAMQVYALWPSACISIYVFEPEN